MLETLRISIKLQTAFKSGDWLNHSETAAQEHQRPGSSKSRANKGLRSKRLRYLRRLFARFGLPYQIEDQKLPAFS